MKTTLATPKVRPRQLRRQRTRIAVAQHLRRLRVRAGRPIW